MTYTFIEATTRKLYTASCIAHMIGSGVTAADIATALEPDEYHPAGRGDANPTMYYRWGGLAPSTVKRLLSAIFAARDARRAAPAETRTGEATATILDFTRRRGGRYSVSRRTLSGPMTLRGQWLTLPTGERVKSTGRRLVELEWKDAR